MDASPRPIPTQLQSVCGSNRDYFCAAISVGHGAGKYWLKMSLTRMKLVFYVICVGVFTTLCVNASVQAKAQDSVVKQLNEDNLVEQLNEDNWSLMLTGEWMVEFYAPWCPACQALEPKWNKLASSKKNLNINVGKVDVTSSPGLSGRFMVTALPTIFHVNDGVFRQYKSPRDEASLIEFVSKKIWMKIEPIPSWKSPTSYQMSLLSQFFKLSQVLRTIHNKLLEDMGLPTWGSYLIFAVATIVLGAMMGLLIVCLIDFIYSPKPTSPPNQQGKKKQNGASANSAQEKASEEDELLENVGDDLVDESEPEKLEKNEEAKNEEVSEPEELEASEKDTDKAGTSSPSVRKRKPRKAD